MADAMNRSFLLFACLTMQGCGIGDVMPKRYLCEGGRLADISFATQTARVDLQSETFDLQRVPSASGERYASARVTLHAKDDEALISVDGRELGPCQQVERKN
jgi:membrane-bound inhibitor of C-type lysozyme